MAALTAHHQAEPLSPGLVQALRDQVPKGDVVFADLETSYELAAYAPARTVPLMSL